MFWSIIMAAVNRIKGVSGNTKCKRHSFNRVKGSYKRGTTVYCWKFLHPKFGWCGGCFEDDWSANKAEIEQRMALCTYPSELIVDKA
jgi:hypothetical protein